MKCSSEKSVADDAAVLQQLAVLYPNRESLISRLAELKAELTLLKPTIHVISDIHGEFKKLKHVINNASGSLRPLVEELFADKLDAAEKMELLNLVHYPRETYTLMIPRLATFDARRDFIERFIDRAAVILRAVAQCYSLPSIRARIPERFRLFLEDLVFAPQLNRSQEYVRAALDEFLASGIELDLIRAVARLIRNLLIAELVIGGDFGDRGPRIDRVIDYVMRQPHVSIVWGNHDMSWLAACLGHELSIATVLRVSLRYRRLSQLEEGYGIPMAPLENLVRTAYGEDPAECFPCKGQGLRDPLLMARMQKAMAIMQFKLEGQFHKRNPQFELGSRSMLHRIESDPASGRCFLTLEGVRHELRDSAFPTIDWNNPYELSEEETRCITRLRESFLVSQTLWQQMQFMVRRGGMYLVRDQNLIFHGCVPCDRHGAFLTLEVDGKNLSGRALFDALQRVVIRALREKRAEDLDMLWYLWAGPCSPLFGKDRMATFESYFIADKQTHHESKNPYFDLIHEREFCLRILSEFGVHSGDGLIVNGHVPVKIDAGEQPLKRSGLAVTIDGAFSEAYGDKGYTLVLDARRTYLARHHHFESATDSITGGADIIPHIATIRSFDPPRFVRDTELGREIQEQIALLSRLALAFEHGTIREAEQ